MTCNYDYPLTLNQNGSIDWETTLSQQTLGGWGLYDSKSAPKLYNPKECLLIRLPQRINQHTGFVAVDCHDEEVAGAWGLKTLLEGFAVKVPQGDCLEF